MYTQKYHVLGWLLRYVAETICRSREWRVSDAKAVVAQVNKNAPLSDRLLVEFSGRLPSGIHPMRNLRTVPTRTRDRRQRGESVGLPRRVRKADRSCTPEALDRTDRNISLGWEDIRHLETATIRRHVTDDTRPGGPASREIEYVALFILCNREDDYRVAWHLPSTAGN